MGTRTMKVSRQNHCYPNVVLPMSKYFAAKLLSKVSKSVANESKFIELMERENRLWAQEFTAGRLAAGRIHSRVRKLAGGYFLIAGTIVTPGLPLGRDRCTGHTLPLSQLPGQSVRRPAFHILGKENRNKKDPLNGWSCVPRGRFGLPTKGL